MTDEESNTPRQLEVWKLKQILEQYPTHAVIRFSIADDQSEDPGERWFVEDGIYDHFISGDEVTICLVGQSNLQESGND